MKRNLSLESPIVPNPDGTWVAILAVDRPFLDKNMTQIAPVFVCQKSYLGFALENKQAIKYKTEAQRKSTQWVFAARSAWMTLRWWRIGNTQGVLSRHLRSAPSRPRQRYPLVDTPRGFRCAS